jgi:hypothetical protein
MSMIRIWAKTQICHYEEIWELSFQEAKRCIHRSFASKAPGRIFLLRVDHTKEHDTLEPLLNKWSNHFREVLIMPAIVLRKQINLLLSILRITMNEDGKDEV